VHQDWRGAARGKIGCAAGGSPADELAGLSWVLRGKPKKGPPPTLKRRRRPPVCGPKVRGFGPPPNHRQKLEIYSRNLRYAYLSCGFRMNKADPLARKENAGAPRRLFCGQRAGVVGGRGWAGLSRHSAVSRAPACAHADIDPTEIFGGGGDRYPGLHQGSGDGRQAVGSVAIEACNGSARRHLGRIRRQRCAATHTLFAGGT